MVRQYNKQYFVLNSDFKQIVFYCYTTNTKNGFCHTAQSLDNSIFGRKITTDTKISYLNRTWERYDYESVLKRACKKLGPEIYKKAFINNEINRTY